MKALYFLAAVLIAAAAGAQQAPAPGVLGPVHRRVGMTQQGLGIRSVVWMQGHAHAG